MGRTKSSTWIGLSFAALLCIVATGCSGASPAASTEAPSPPTTQTEAAAGVSPVSLGDSTATANGDEDGTGWVQRYADLVAEQTGTQVDVLAHARSGLTSSALLAEVREDPIVRDHISATDILLIGAGGADLNEGDDAWSAGTCNGPACYAPVLAAYERNIAQVAAVVAELRADRPTVFRAVAPPMP